MIDIFEAGLDIYILPPNQIPGQSIWKIKINILTQDYNVKS